MALLLLLLHVYGIQSCRCCCCVDRNLLLLLLLLHVYTARLAWLRCWSFCKWQRCCVSCWCCSVLLVCRCQC
jgi:hypothetical protein